MPYPLIERTRVAWGREGEFLENVAGVGPGHKWVLHHQPAHSPIYYGVFLPVLPQRKPVNERREHLGV